MTTTSTTPPAPHAPPASDDPRALFARAVDLGGQVIGAVRPEQLDAPTPCTDLDVRHLLDHLVEVLHRVAALGRGEDPFALPATGDPSDDGWLAAWRAASHDVQAAWTDGAVLEREMSLPWITAPGGTVLLHYVSEVTVHTWDLATATGQMPTWDDQVLQAAFSSIRAALPAENRRATFEAVLAGMPPELRRTAMPFAEAVPVAADAPLLHRLMAWTGRCP